MASITTKSIQTETSTKPRLSILDVLLYLASGTYFGLVAYKSEIISWYRIQEMFRFQSFHMYGIIGSAVVVGTLSLSLIRYFKLTTIHNESISLKPKSKTVVGNLVGGTIFGFGWAMTGACPGPLYALVGSGSTVFIVVILSALLGTWTYGSVKKYLPH